MKIEIYEAVLEINSHINIISSNHSEQRDSTSSHGTNITPKVQNLKGDEIYLMKTPNQSNNETLQIDKSKLKQFFHSQLTMCQIIFFILNFIGIIVFIILIIVFSKVKHTKSGKQSIIIRRRKIFSFLLHTIYRSIHY